MKITIAYTADEERDACTAARQLLRLFPAIRVHKSDNNGLYHHVYMTTRKPGKPSEGAENA